MLEIDNEIDATGAAIGLHERPAAVISSRSYQTVCSRNHYGASHAMAQERYRVAGQ